MEGLEPEHIFRNQQVAGSSPAGGSNTFSNIGSRTHLWILTQFWHRQHSECNCAKTGFALNIFKTWQNVAMGAGRFQTGETPMPA
jgi:hypothetical protein